MGRTYSDCGPHQLISVKTCRLVLPYCLNAQKAIARFATPLASYLGISMTVDSSSQRWYHMSNFRWYVTTHVHVSWLDVVHV
jgi:hypothetical protein